MHVQLLHRLLRLMAAPAPKCDTTELEYCTPGLGVIAGMLQLAHELFVVVAPHYVRGKSAGCMRSCYIGWCGLGPH